MKYLCNLNASLDVKICDVVTFDQKIHGFVDPNDTQVWAST